MTKKPFKKLFRRIRDECVYLVLMPYLFLFPHLPRRLVLFLAGSLGSLAYRLMKKPRIRAIDNLTRVFGNEKSEKEIRAVARKVFINMAKNAADVFYTRKARSFSDIRKIVDIEGLEHLDEALQNGKGAIGLCCHMGAFELITNYLSLKGYPVATTGTRMKSEKLNRLLVENREKMGITNLYRGAKIGNLLRHLKRGGVVGILIDQDTRVKGVFVDFFGIPAYTPIGVALLALRTGASVFPGAIRRVEGDRHLITFRPVVKLIRTGDFEKDLEENTRLFTHELEQLIRNDISQWPWMHRRWRTALEEDGETPDRGRRSAAHRRSPP